MPAIFLWQLIYSFFNYGELIKREPGSLGIRVWSSYGKLYLRHFNELDHELKVKQFNVPTVSESKQALFVV